MSSAPGATWRAVRPFYRPIHTLGQSLQSRSVTPRALTARSYKATPLYYEYPKEGVFQPNSPPRQPANSSYNLEPNRYFPHQSQNQPSQAYVPQQQPYCPPEPTKFSFNTFRWTSKWTWVTAGLFVIFGTSTSFIYITYKALDIVGIPWEPGSEEDQEQLHLLSEEFDALQLVQQLRSEWRMNPETHQQERLWHEWTAYKAVQGRPGSQNRLTTGPLRGSRGVAAQRIFWNEAEGLCMVFVNFGEGCCGWPGVVHGGAIATVVDESLGRCAMWSLGDMKESGETVQSLDGSSSNKKTPMVTAALEISFQDKCEPEQWYVIVSELDRFHAHENNDRKRFVAAAMVCANELGPSKEEILGDDAAPAEEDDREDTGTGAHVHVSATALFVAPKGQSLRPMDGEF